MSTRSLLLSFSFPFSFAFSFSFSSPYFFSARAESLKLRQAFQEELALQRETSKKYVEEARVAKENLVKVNEEVTEKEKEKGNEREKEGNEKEKYGSETLRNMLKKSGWLKRIW
jgi:hypothetical protein